jgi:acyl-coenzyme A thioesterase PaaI-like protein
VNDAAPVVTDQPQASPQGRTQQLRQVEMHRPDDGKLVARGQVRLQNIEAS